MKPTANAIITNDYTSYRLIRLLGKGGFGEVWTATATDSNLKIALKFLRPEVLLTLPSNVRAEIQRRFRRESRNSLILNHANIVPTLFVGEADGTPYFAMPLYIAGDLRKSLTSQRRDSLDTMIGICRGLQYLHDLGIIHRDIKPQNILFDNGEPRIADFGLAKWSAFLMSPESYPLTHSDEVLGTIRYMSPEQRKGAKNVDHRADLYSLGLVFYEIVTMNPISTDDLAFGVDRSKDVQQQFTYPGVDDVFRTLTQQSLSARYSSAKDVVESLGQYREFSKIADRYIRHYYSKQWINNAHLAHDPNWNSFTGGRCSRCGSGPDYTYVGGWGARGHKCVTCAHPELLESSGLEQTAT